MFRKPGSPGSDCANHFLWGRSGAGGSSKAKMVRRLLPLPGIHSQELQQRLASLPRRGSHPFRTRASSKDRMSGGSTEGLSPECGVADLGRTLGQSLPAWAWPVTCL